jgi:uncharacterized protein
MMSVRQSGLFGLTTQEFILQPTSFCNMNCDYCYLPLRQARRRMSRDTLSLIFQAIFSSSLIADHVRIVWHAGEPMTMPIRFYEEAFQLIEQHNPCNIPFTFVFQTNGMHITQRWCDFINTHSHQIDISISLDGPQPLHDAYRVDRTGRGTFARIMHNIDLLQANGIFPTALMVLTRETLASPDALWQFLLERGIRSVAFLLQEALGAVQEIPLNNQDDLESYRAFLRRILALRETCQHPPFIREIDGLIEHLTTAEHQVHSQANTPLAVISFDCDGNISTLSPELLTLGHPRYAHFLFGNVSQNRLEDVLSHPTFQHVNAEVQRGVAMCKETCEYFVFCGGGSPVNKLSETGTFAATETTHCRLKIKTTTDVVMEHLQQSSQQNVP